MGYSPPGSSVHGDSPGKNIGVGCHALFRGDLPDSGIEPGSSALQVDSLPTELSGKPYNYECHCLEIEADKLDSFKILK